MKGEFLAGAALGAAVVAACYNPAFRDACAKAINGAGEQLNKQISGLLAELNGKPAKEQTNDDGQGALAVRAE